MGSTSKGGMTLVTSAPPRDGTGQETTRARSEAERERRSGGREELVHLILDHHARPRRKGRLENPDAVVSGGNPGCGDIITVYLKLRDNRVVALSFEGEGCILSQAAASMLFEKVAAEGWHVEEILSSTPAAVRALVGEEMLRLRPSCATLGQSVLKAAVRKALAQGIRPAP